MSPVTIFTDRLFNVFFFSLNYSLHKALQLLKKFLNSKRTLEMIQIKIIKNQLRQLWRQSFSAVWNGAGDLQRWLLVDVMKQRPTQINCENTMFDFSKLFWSDRGGSGGIPAKISSCDMDGSAISNILTNNMAGVQHIALDILERKIYWADTSAGAVRRCTQWSRWAKTMLAAAVPIFVLTT